MNVVVTVSGYIIPAVMLFIVIHGMIKKVNVYDEFVTGAKDGMKTVVSIGLLIFVAIPLPGTGGWRASCIGIFRYDIRFHRKIYRKNRTSITCNSIAYSKNVQFISSDRADA